MLLGYTYNWVKSVLREKVFGQLKIVLSLDFPRVAPISTASTSSEKQEEAVSAEAGSFVEGASFAGTAPTPKRFSLMTGKGRASRMPAAQAPQQARPTSRGRSARAGGKRSAAVTSDEGKQF